MAVDSQRHAVRWIRGGALLFLVLGVAVNRYTLAWVAGDGAIESLLFNGIILAAQITSLGVALYLWRYPAWASIGNLALMFVAMLLMLVVGEALARVFVFGAAGLSYRALDSTADFGHAGLIQASEAPGLIFELKPHHERLFALEAWQTNSHGMRYPEIEQAKSSDVVRVAVLGDSFTAPMGVALEDAYHQRLERQAAAAFPAWRFQFLNFGVPGYQLPQYVAQLEHRVLAFEPDIILLGFCAENDHMGMSPNYLATPYVPPPPKSGFWRSILVELLLRVNYVPLIEMDKSLDEEARQFVDEHFVALARLAGPIPVVVAYLANMPRPAAGVAALARKHGFSFVDLSSHFTETALREHSIYYPIDAHPNSRAQEIFADVIFEHLKTTGMLDAVMKGREREGTQ